VQLTTRYGDGLPLILGNDNQLRQVLVNLVQNGVESVPAERQGAVRVLASGGQFLSPELSELAIRSLRGADNNADDAFSRLSAREIQVLRLIALGKSNKEIAAILGLSANTVAVHRTNLMNTLGVHKTAELVLLAVKKGLVESP
jgi:DNA-binding NarL/FixJ family response regulator